MCLRNAAQNKGQLGTSNAVEFSFPTWLSQIDSNRFDDLFSASSSASRFRFLYTIVYIVAIYTENFMEEVYGTDVFVYFFYIYGKNLQCQRLDQAGWRDSRRREQLHVYVKLSVYSVTLITFKPAVCFVLFCLDTMLIGFSTLQSRAMCKIYLCIVLRLYQDTKTCFLLSWGYSRAIRSLLALVSFQRNIPSTCRPVGKLCETWAHIFRTGGRAGRGVGRLVG